MLLGMQPSEQVNDKKFIEERRMHSQVIPQFELAWSAMVIHVGLVLMMLQYICYWIATFGLQSL